jgi:RNA polymerase sigma-70 factor (ECF subfamily)
MEIVLPLSENRTDVEDIGDNFRGLDPDEQKLLVAESLGKIPPRESLSLQLFYLEGNSLEEIAGLTGWSESNVKVILHRARKHMLDVVNVLMDGELINRTK